MTLLVRTVFVPLVMVLNVRASPAHKSTPTRHPGFLLDSENATLVLWCWIGCILIYFKSILKERGVYPPLKPGWDSTNHLLGWHRHSVDIHLGWICSIHWYCCSRLYNLVTQLLVDICRVCNISFIDNWHHPIKRWCLIVCLWRFHWIVVCEIFIMNLDPVARLDCRWILGLLRVDVDVLPLGAAV